MAPPKIAIRLFCLKKRSAASGGLTPPLLLKASGGEAFNAALAIVGCGVDGNLGFCAAAKQASAIVPVTKLVQVSGPHLLREAEVEGSFSSGLSVRVIEHCALHRLTDGANMTECEIPDVMPITVLRFAAAVSLDQRQHCRGRIETTRAWVDAAARKGIERSNQVIDFNILY